MGGFLSAMKESRGSVVGGYHPSNPRSASIFGLHPTTAGVTVNSETAMGLAAYWAAIRNISEDVAKLPLGVYVRSGQTRTERDDDPVSLLMNHRPNPEAIPMTFRQTMTMYALSHGRGIAEIEMGGDGRPINLWPIKPQDVTIQREKESGRLVYVVRSDRHGGRTVSMYDDRVLHIMGMSLDGCTGISVLQYAKESLGLGMAAERFGSGFFGNSGVPSLAIKLMQGKTLKDGGRKLKESWGDAHKGSNNRGVGVLEDGAEIQMIGIPPNDSQFLETRQFQVTEIARWFRMPPHKLMDLLRGTFSNIEHQSIEYVGDCLDPWLRRWEQEIERKLFTAGDGRYARHNTAALLRTDTESRYRAHAIAVQWGWRNPDDVRALEDENPLPDGQGEAYMRPGNMVSAAKFGQEDEAQGGSQQEDGRSRLRSMLEAHAPVLADAFGRSLKVETERHGRQLKRDDFADWSDRFYGEHRDHLRGLLFPQMEAIASLCVAAGFANIDAAGLAREATERHVAESRRRLDAAEDVGAELGRWPARAEEAARAEIERIINTITGAAGEAAQ